MRAPRFPLQLAMRYRPLGGEWRHATTGDVSSSGVFVQVQNPPKINTHIEFKLALAATDTGAPGEVHGRGRVVRVVAPIERPQAGFAVAIEEYDFLSTDPRRHAAGKKTINTQAP
jgi:hypothetical protein